MALQLDEIIEWIDAVQLASVNQAHEQISHPRSIPGLVKQRVFAMQNGFLQRTLDQIMPTAGLCRVNWILNVRHCFRMMAGAA